MLLFTSKEFSNAFIIIDLTKQLQRQGAIEVILRMLLLANFMALTFLSSEISKSGLVVSKET
jgi:hypothetical protein